MTDAMKDIMIKIMVEVLEVFAIMTKEIKQSRASESIPDDRFPVLTELREVPQEIFQDISGNEGYRRGVEQT